MKRMNNACEGRFMGLLGRILRLFGERLAEVNDPCWLVIWYEPSLSEEVIKEMAEIL